MIRINRGNLRTILIIAAVLFMSFSRCLFITGTAVFFFGLILHFLSKGFLHRNKELATHGPYSFFRHPFYIANLLLDTGIIFMSGHPVFIPVYAALYYMSYSRVIAGEEKNLTDIFGGKYTAYTSAVPRYAPRVTPYAKDWIKGFRWENIVREREVSRLIRLASYPVSFLAVHRILAYKFHETELGPLVLEIFAVILLRTASYLFYTKLERRKT